MFLLVENSSGVHVTTRNNRLNLLLKSSKHKNYVILISALTENIKWKRNRFDCKDLYVHVSNHVQIFYVTLQQL